MKIFGNNTHLLNEYLSKFPLANRDSGSLVKSTLQFAKWLGQKHLEGWVLADISSININTNHELEFRKLDLKRPSTDFSALEKALVKPIVFLDENQDNTFINTLKAQFSGPRLIIKNKLAAPEQDFNHHDQRTDVFCLGLLIAQLFSDFDIYNLESLQTIIEGRLDNNLWLHQDLKTLVRKCVRFEPNKRLGLSQAEDSLVQLAQHYIDINEELSGETTYQKVLKSFKASLLDFSAKNQLFSFSLSAQNLKIEAQVSSIIEEGFTWSFENEKNSEALRKLQNIRRTRNQEIREKGEDPIRLLTHFLSWRWNGQELETPLFWASVNLKYDKGFRTEYSVKIEDDFVQINEVLRIYFKEHFKFVLPNAVSQENVPSFIAELEAELSQNGAEVIQIYEQLVLGNFSYQNISISTDYDELLKQGANRLNHNLLGFEKYSEHANHENIAHWDNHFVLPADPSQESALIKARNSSLVIEGPPGTGKSQTITNLIAQAIENGEKVLFVSEKRAALDVVFNKMQQVNLDYLSLLVHNSRKEKKEIIGSIKKALDRLTEPLERDAKLGKNLASWKLEETFKTIDEYYQTVRNKKHGFSLNELFGFSDNAKISFEDDWTPDLEDWLKQEKELFEIKNGLETNGQIKVWKECIYSKLDERSFAITDTPSVLLKESINKATNAILTLKPLLSNLQIDLVIGDLLQVRSMAASLKWLIERNLVKLVLEDNALKHEYEKLRNQYFSKKALLTKRRQKNSIHNFNRITLRELESALYRCENEPNSEELKNFAKQFVESENWFLDDVKSIIKNAIFEYKNEIQLSEIEAKFQSQFKTSNPDDFIEQVSLLEDLTQRMQYHLGAFFGVLNAKRQPDSLLELFLKEDNAFSDLDSAGYLLHKNFRNLTPDGFSAHIQELKTVSITPSIHKLLRSINELKPSLKYCLLNADIAIKELKQASIKRELQRAFLANPDLEKFNSKKINGLFNELNDNYQEWLNWNSHKLIDFYVTELQRLSTLTSIPVAKLTENEKQEKWRFKKGLRIIRNEVDKARSHKSLRELVNSEAKAVLDVLKPIYLMSPLAVSEVFPCQKGLFDLVVFDEASQLRLEEVLPIVHRAKRVVVVGDSEQLPPTDFFRSNTLKAQTADNLKFASFLLAAKATFRSEQLHWHYRSQSKELIQFSNAAFYKNKLNVFPSFGAEKPAIRTKKLAGIYANRANKIEAESIVDYLDQLLKSNSNSTFAIIALSESQKQCIENAIDAKRESDKAFDILIEREEARFENNAFEGLLVKNLENMQGEERDVVLISLGYGKDEEGRFRQNLGPIMREGGDRRLNVLLSRAKCQMVLFHSFDEKELKNDQNIGLWTLKLFLSYAKAVEHGDESGQKRVIQLLRRIDESELNEQPEETDLISLLSAQQEPDIQLKPLFVANAQDQVYYQQFKNGIPIEKLLELEAEKPDTWKEFFISKHVLANRGFFIEKLSTQNVLKKKLNTDH